MDIQNLKACLSQVTTHPSGKKMLGPLPYGSREPLCSCCIRKIKKMGTYETKIQTRHISGIQKEIDALGFSWYQMMILLLTGGVMFSEGSEMLIMGSITTLLHNHWDLSPVLRGLMVSMVFIGFSLGNLISGRIGDGYGRRPAILLAYLMIGIFGLLTSSAWSSTSMVMFRFGVGVGCGIGFPAVYSLMPEVCPTKIRGMLSSLMIGFMPLGELFAALVLLWVDPYLNKTRGHCELGIQMITADETCSWRSLCAYSALPAFFFFILSYFFLPESPHFLAVNGREEELEQVMERMRWLNGPPREEKQEAGETTPLMRSSTTLEETISHSFLDVLRHLIVGSYYRTTTLFLFLAHMCKDFSVFGLTYVFPQYFLSLENVAPAVQLTIIASLAIPGVLIAVALTRYPHIGHIRCIQILSLCTAVCTLGMFEFAPKLLGIICAYVVKFLALSYFIVIVVYTAEVFPTAIRNSSVGICVGIGRLGSISAPLLFELSHHYSKGSFDIFMSCLLGSMLLVSFLSRPCLPHETKGLSIEVPSSTKQSV